MRDAADARVSKRRRYRIGLLALALWIGIPAGLEAAPFVYVSNDADRTVSVIDAASNTVTATVPADGRAGVTVNRDGTRVYAAGGATVSVIDTASNTVTATVDVGDPATLALGGLALSPSGKQLYVAATSGTAPGTTVKAYVIDAVQDKLGTSQDLGAGSGVAAVALNPAGTPLYVVSAAGVQLVDPSTLSPLTSIALPGAAGLAVSPAGDRLYVTNQGGTSTIDAATDGVIGIVGSIMGPGIAVNPAGTRLYIGFASQVVVADAATTQFLKAPMVGSGAAGIAIDASGTRVYVANSGSDSVSVIDAGSNAVVATVRVGSAPHAVAVGPSGVCGNGAIDPGEECDDGGTCAGGANAGSACTSDEQCSGADSVCRPVGGDGCAANCTHETDIPISLVAGVVAGQSLLPGTSGVVISGSAQVAPLALTGTLTFRVGKQRDGEIPVVVRGGALQLPALPLSGPACACLRTAVPKTCGGIRFAPDGVTPATDCSQDAGACPAGNPCAPVFGAGNAAAGVIRCDGLDGVRVSTSKNGPGPVSTQLSGIGGIGPAGSMRLLDTVQLGVIDGSCTGTGGPYGADGQFCTADDAIAAQGPAVTATFVTGGADATLLNANGTNGTTIGPVLANGAPFDCSALAGGTLMGGAAVAAVIVPGVPSFGDAAVTAVFAAPGAPQPTLTPTITPTPQPPTPTPTSTPVHVCTGDCNGNGKVTVTELLIMVNVALDRAQVSSCFAGDANHDGKIAVNEILQAVTNALRGCPAS